VTKINFILLFLLSTLQLFAQEKTDSSKTEKVEYALYPMAFYTPETQFAFGGGGMIYSRLGVEQGLPPSKITIGAYYTTNGQYNLSIDPVLYFGGSAGIISESKFVYSNEISKFYGIGNNTPELENPDYAIKYFRVYTEFGFNVGGVKNLHAGIIYEFTTNDMVSKGDNPDLVNDLVLGSNGGKTSGFGLLIVSDHRDNIFFPKKNGFLKLRMVLNGKKCGSDFSYERYVVDFRRYYDLGNSNIIAGQIYFEYTHGEVPFFKLPDLGGSYRMRGYFQGRYRDNTYLTGQIEYRKMFWWRLGAVAFVGMGDVAPKSNQFELTQFKYSYGFGLRFLFDEKENLNVRMDIGFGKGTSGIYFALEEAF